MAAAPTDSRRSLRSVIGVGWAAAMAALVLAVDVEGTGWITSHDPGWSRWVVEHRSPFVDLAEVVTVVGSFGVLVLLAVVTTIGLGLVGRRRRVTLAPLVSLLCTGLVVYLSKRLFDRDRPDLALHLDHVSDPSFPSGHAADSMAFFLALGMVLALGLERPGHRRLAVGAGALASLLVGLTRPILGVHWPTDVIAGWALGATVSLLVVTWLATNPDGVSPRS
jgi:undecaprenyl-diphosphatase